MGVISSMHILYTMFFNKNTDENSSVRSKSFWGIIRGIFSKSPLKIKNNTHEKSCVNNKSFWGLLRGVFSKTPSFKLHYGNAEVALAIGTGSVLFNTPVALEITPESRTERACTLAVNESYG